jgi:hypothetical protein
MPRSKLPPKTSSVRRLKIYCMGPGFGESIVLHLPCGGWGVVDGFHGAKGGTLEFLKEMRVQRLKFFCLTHPHDDHYRGTYRLISRYAGKIERIWRFPGLTVKDIQNLALAGRARAKYVGDPEADKLSSDYLKLVQSFVRERDGLTDETYRQVAAPVTLLSEEDYTIEARGPGTADIERFQQQFAKIVIKTAPLLLSEEGGELINSISVVLAIKFGDAKIFLLGDAQGPALSPDSVGDNIFSVIKVAHHGSTNGLGANFLTVKSNPPRVACAILTPYTRSGLPSPGMAKMYADACKKLIRTRQAPSRAPKSSVPGMGNARVLSDAVSWVGIEIFESGAIRQFQ